MYVVSRYQNPHEHSPGDTIDKLDLWQVAMAADGVTEAVRRLASGPTQAAR